MLRGRPGPSGLARPAPGHRNGRKRKDGGSTKDGVGRDILSIVKKEVRCLCKVRTVAQ